MLFKLKLKREVKAIKNVKTKRTAKKIPGNASAPYKIILK
jgi:hypothetical protein